MKILACIYINGNSNACMPTTTPLAVRTTGQTLTQGKHIISGEIVGAGGELTLVVHSAAPAPDMQEFMFCAATPNQDGIIESTGLVCGFDGPFAGRLMDVVQGEAFFTTIITRDSGEAVLPDSLAVAAAPAAKDEDAAIDAHVEDRNIVITEGFLEIPFPVVGGPCPGLCTEPKPSLKKQASMSRNPTIAQNGRNHISPEEITTF